jgi:hypothetical protein
MLDSFFVKNFRLFKSFELKRLARLNLFVGKNNSGKSALLEAIRLYACNGDISVMVDLVMNRQEGGQQQTGNQPSGDIPIRHLFHGRALPELEEEGIVLGPISPPDEQLQVYIAGFRREKDEYTGITRLIRVHPASLEDLQYIEFSLVAREGDKVRRLAPADDEPDRHPSSRPRRSWGITPRYPIKVVPTQNMTEKELADLWDRIALTDLGDEVISCLQLMDTEITALAYVGGTNSWDPSFRIPKIRRRNESEPLPLKSLGDGIIRVFHIIVALVNAQNGILLIDEFENGLHWSVQPKIWKTVLSIAEKLNVQVFATTHSRDCIAGFEEAWKEQESLGAFFRLNVRQDVGVTATPYSCETLSDALETDVEMR